MSNSWGHAVRPLTEDEIASDARHGWTCSTGTCVEAVTHATCYSYVTGRAGRVSWSERKVCAVHAMRFAAKYDIDIAAAPKPEHALQRLLADGGLRGSGESEAD